MMMMQSWEVKLWYRDIRGVCESGINSAWPVGTHPLKIIQEVAEWRSVDLSICTDISCAQIGEPWEKIKEIHR